MRNGNGKRWAALDALVVLGSCILWADDDRPDIRRACPGARVHGYPAPQDFYAGFGVSCGATLEYISVPHDGVIEDSLLSSLESSVFFICDDFLVCPSHLAWADRSGPLLVFIPDRLKTGHGFLRPNDFYGGENTQFQGGRVSRVRPNHLKREPLFLRSAVENKIEILSGKESINTHPRAIGFERPLGGDGSAAGGFGGGLRIIHANAHVPELYQEHDQLPGADRGQDKSGIDGGPFRGPPIWQRFFECVALGGLGLGGAVWCIEHLDDKWRRLSTALIGGCCLLVIGAFGLLWSALLPATWGWWL
jgi:hypothetical protein